MQRYNLPSVKRIEKFLGVTTWTAKLIRTHMEDYRDNKISLYLALDRIDTAFIINDVHMSHGLESFSTNKGNHYIYCNRGGTDEATIIGKECTGGNPFILNSWGNIVEKEDAN